MKDNTKNRGTNVKNEVPNEKTRQPMVGNLNEVTRDKAPPKKRRTRRTVTTVLRAAFPKAPADLLELMQRRLSVDTLKEFRELNNHQIEEGIRQGCYRYSNRLIGKPESSTKTFLSLLRNYADSANISYDSLFSYRASSSLPGIIRELASGGKGQVKHIRQALD